MNSSTTISSTEVSSLTSMAYTTSTSSPGSSTPHGLTSTASPVLTSTTSPHLTSTKFLDLISTSPDTSPTPSSHQSQDLIITLCVSIPGAFSIVGGMIIFLFKMMRKHAHREENIEHGDISTDQSEEQETSFTDPIAFRTRSRDSM